MDFDGMKKAVDVIQVNAPIIGAFTLNSLADLETLLRIGALIVGVICTIIVTRHKTKQKDKDE